MRRRSVVASAALIAALALGSLPVPVGSQQPSSARDVDGSAFRPITLSTMDAREIVAIEPLDAAYRALGFLTGTSRFMEPAVDSPVDPVVRPSVDQPGAPAGTVWKPPKYTISGYATFYDNGTTAMRLPRGTIVRICGNGGCLERVINDYGPYNVKGRIVDLYRPDFFAICGCAWFAGTTYVTVSIS